MSQYTFQQFSLVELNTIEQQKSAFIDSLNIKLAAPDLLVKDLALMLKSLEVMENMEHLPEYKDFLQKAHQIKRLSKEKTERAKVFLFINNILFKFSDINLYF